MKYQRAILGESFGFNFNKDLYFRILEAKQYFDYNEKFDFKPLKIAKTIFPNGTSIVLKEQEHFKKEEIPYNKIVNITKTTFPDGTVKIY